MRELPTTFRCSVRPLLCTANAVLTVLRLAGGRRGSLAFDLFLPEQFPHCPLGCLVRSSCLWTVSTTWASSAANLAGLKRLLGIILSPTPLWLGVSASRITLPVSTRQVVTRVHYNGSSRRQLRCAGICGKLSAMSPRNANSCRKLLHRSKPCMAYRITRLTACQGSEAVTNAMQGRT